MSSEWTMPRRASACAGCQREFEIGEALQAFLYDTAEGYQRLDYCTACAPPEDPIPVGSWRTQRPVPATKKVQPFDREAIYGFFERLEDAEHENQLQFRFVLALLLWRKKVLKLERTASVGDREVWEFTAAQTGSPHRVERPALAEDQLEHLSAQLEQLLAGQPGDLDVAADVTAEDRDE